MANICFDFESIFKQEYQKRLAGASLYKYLDDLNIDLNSFIKDVVNKENYYYFSCSSLTREVKRKVSHDVYHNFFLRPTFKSNILPNNKTFLINGDFIFETNNLGVYFKVNDIYISDNEKIKKFEKEFNFKWSYKQSGKKANSDSILVRNIIESTPLIYDKKSIDIINKWDEYLEFEKKFFSDKLGFYKTRNYSLIELKEVKRTMENVKRYKESIYHDDGNNYLYIYDDNLDLNREEDVQVIEFEVIIKNSSDAFNKLSFFVNQEIEIANPLEALDKNGKLVSNSNDLDFSFRTKRIGGLLKPLEVVAKNESETIYRFSKFWIDENTDYFSSIARINEYIITNFGEFPLLVNILSGDIALYKRGKQALTDIKTGNVKNPGLIGYLMNVDNASSDEYIKKEDLTWSTSYLDEYQKEAIYQALNSNSIFLLQGPPGTGKTQTITEMVYQFNKMNKKVLLSSQTHVAIDNVLERLPDELNILPIRLINSERKLKASRNFLPDKLVDNFYEKTINKYNNTIENFHLYSKEVEDYLNDYNKVNNLASKHKESRDKVHNLDLRINNLKSLLNNLDDKLESNQQLIKDSKSTLKFISDFRGNNFEYMDYKINNLDNSILRGITTLTNKYDIDNIYHLEGATLNDYLKLFSIYFGDNQNFKEDYHELINRNLDNIEAYYQKTARAIVDISLEIELENAKRINYLNDRRKLEVERNKLYKASQDDFKVIDDYFNYFFNNKLNINKVPPRDEEKLALIKSYIDEQIENFELTKHKFNNYQDIYRNSIDFLANKQGEDLENDRIKYSRYLLNNNANVFGITCNANSRYLQERNQYLKSLGLGNIDLRNIDFDVVIIDEVSKATFVELLIPILYGKSIVLVGDHRQLPPMFKYRDNMFDHLSEDKRISKEKLNQYQEMVENSVFKHLFSVAKKNKYTLLKQYRSHEQIMEIVNLFYEDKLQMGHRSEQNEAKKHLLDINSEHNGRNIFTPHIHTYWFNSHYNQDRSVSYEKKLTRGSDVSTSFYNEQEIHLTKNILKTIDKGYSKLLKKGEISEAPTVGVISLYGDQVRLLKREVGKLNFKALDFSKSKISTVDEFQGKEEDIIIVNLVRNNKSGHAGEFTRKFERLNVALSRARKMLIVVGSVPFFSNLKIDIENSDNPSIIKTRYLYKEIYDRIKGKINEPNGYFKEDES